jgi:hypothetical protein
LCLAPVDVGGEALTVVAPGEFREDATVPLRLAI